MIAIPIRHVSFTDGFRQLRYFVFTNGAENFRALLKRGIYGIYGHKMRPFGILPQVG